ncbi:Adenylyl cyclase-associated protein 1 [Thelohanellus kitauei]|uniref:Adenylyl cyclase-associated protein 1 n=1 Tax=Thelohanellus kitauei TaxID=669202 RepID=A0A0C2IYS6_THEKT|nr:Adenylyl cyclase-associated protein 1 [Thelohanellus kitauei]
MQAERLEEAIQRLEKVADRLESVGVKSTAKESTSTMVSDFEAIIDGPVVEFIKLSQNINQELYQGCLLLQNAFNINCQIMRVVSTSKKPADDVFAKILKPLCDSIDSVKDYSGKHFKSDFKTHYDALVAYSSCFAWIQAAGKPQQYIAESIESGVFYTNRVLKDPKFKYFRPTIRSEDHKAWVNALKSCFDALKEYAQEHHSMGCSWNPKGSEAALQPSTKTPQSTAKAEKPETKGPPPAAAIFSAISSKGLNITSGLKKVDDSQKTHKNPNLRATAIVSDTGPKAPKTKVAADVTAKPPKMELEGTTWSVENQVNQQMLEIKGQEKKYKVYIYNCQNTNVVVHHKLNVVSIDKCHNVIVHLKSGLIATCEVTNSKKVEVYTDDVLPMVNINSSHGVQVVVNEKSTSTQVTTNMSSTVNLCLSTPTVEFTEYPIPEVFVSQLVDGKLDTKTTKI